MSALRKSMTGFAAAISLGVLAAGCGSVGDMGLGGAKQTMLGAKPGPQSPDLPESPKLVMPAPNTPLPAPGEAPAKAWTATTQQPNQQAAVTPPKEESSGSWYSGITGVFGSKTQ